MELLIIAIGAGLIIIASVVRALVARSRHLPLGSDPESERARRDIQRAKNLGQSHFVGLDNTGDHR